MMGMRLRDGSIFDSRAAILVCPVNTVGVMGKGLAKAFADRFIGLAQFHAEVSEQGRFGLGLVAVKTCRERGTDDYRSVCLLPTKGHWRNPSRLSLIYAGLGGLAIYLEQTNPDVSAALPALGCGLGGLRWPDVLPLIEQFCGLFPTREFDIYRPQE
jgi:O-acetyl-ADP-ribose deacetylase (regulator of RNase III)